MSSAVLLAARSGAMTRGGPAALLVSAALCACPEPTAAKGGFGGYYPRSSTNTLYRGNIGYGKRNYAAAGASAYRRRGLAYYAGGRSYAPAYVPGAALILSHQFYGTRISRDRSCSTPAADPMPTPNRTKAWVWVQAATAIDRVAFEPVELEVDLFRDVALRSPCCLPTAVVVLRMCAKDVPHNNSGMPAPLTDRERNDSSTCTVCGSTHSMHSAARRRLLATSVVTVIEVAVGVSDAEDVDVMLAAVNESFADPDSQVRQLYKVRGNGATGYVFEEDESEVEDMWDEVFKPLSMLVVVGVCFGTVCWVRKHGAKSSDDEDEDISRQTIVGPRWIHRRDISNSTLTQCQLDTVDIVNGIMDNCTINKCDLKGSVLLRNCTTTQADVYGYVIVDGGSFKHADVKPGGRLRATYRAQVEDVDNYDANAAVESEHSEPEPPAATDPSPLDSCCADTRIKTPQATPSVGDHVTVTTGFMSDNKFLRAGLQGTVKWVDGDGDAVIEFDELPEAQWVLQCNFGHITFGQSEEQQAVASWNPYAAAADAAGPRNYGSTT